jgi:NadR type nicotinamide-nucleotide adenylyltransferase
MTLPSAAKTAANVRPPVAVVTGSESTGKTTLAADLARHFGGMFVPEYARRYADTKLDSTGIPLDASDVEPIASGQIALHDRAFRNATRLLVLDTDLVSTVVYARHYYGDCPPWIEQAAAERRGDLYLLCDIDVPWVPGRHRDRPHAREEIHAMFVTAVDALGIPVVVVRGSWEERFAIATAAVATLLSRSPSGAR